MNARGVAGITHCGSWTKRRETDRYWPRVVCNRVAIHKGLHRSADGWEWSRTNPTPRKGRRA